jgi:acyl-[acyl carrier protein]--UDP-N-acetylglucosamine O-acyltransferase
VISPSARIEARRRRRATEKLTRQVLRGPVREAYAAFGNGSVFGYPVRVTRPDCIFIGENVIIHEGGWLSVVEAHEGYPPRLVIGDGCRFGRELSIACVGEITIGNDVMSSDDVFIADCYHDYQDPIAPVLHQPMSRPEPVHIADGAYLGACSIVLPGVTIGERAYIGEGAVVTRDVPPGAVVYGNPARVVQGA